MSLEDYRSDCTVCSRCSYCKFIPFEQIKSSRFARACPSTEDNGFHAYSLGGRLSVALSLLESRIEYNQALKDIVWKCQMDGACDVSNKICRYNVEGMEVLREMRLDLVEKGQTLTQHQQVLDCLHKEHNMVNKSASARGQWAAGLGVKDLTKEKAQVVFHAGCRYSYDEGLQNTARKAVSILKNAGVDIGIMGQGEFCCGGRANQWGYKKEEEGLAQRNLKAWAKAGVKIVVTPCSECYYSFKRLYPEAGSQIEVLHVVEYLERLIKDGTIKLTKAVPLTVTYHDPCHLGRLGEPYVAWKGKRKKIYGQIPVWDPPKPRYIGALGIYDAPRNVLKSIPGLKLVEMERIREYAWCCGAGGGVLEAYPEFAQSTAKERIEEAASTGAEILVSACPWCERNFKDTVSHTGQKMQVMDVIDLVAQSM